MVWISHWSKRSKENPYILYLQLVIMIFYFRLWMEKQIEICQNLLWYPNIWHYHHGQSSKNGWYFLSNWRHYGTSHWILYYQCSGDHLLFYKNFDYCSISQEINLKSNPCEKFTMHTANFLITHFYFLNLALFLLK